MFHVEHCACRPCRSPPLFAEANAFFGRDSRGRSFRMRSTQRFARPPPPACGRGVGEGLPPASAAALLADAEAAEQGIEHIFGGGAAEQAVEGDAGEAQAFGDEQGIVEAGGGGEAFVGFGEEAVLALV